MKIAIGALAGITTTMLAYILFQPAIERHQLMRFARWIFTRVEVATHPDCKPRYWTKHAGVITREPWT